MDFSKFKLGNGGIFGVCDGLSNFTGISVLAFRVLALFLLYKGLFTFYFFAWVLLFVSGKETRENKKSVIDVKLGNSKGRPKTKSREDKWEEFERKFEKHFDDDNFKSKNKKKSKKDMSYDNFKKSKRFPN